MGFISRCIGELAVLSPPARADNAVLSGAGRAPCTPALRHMETPHQVLDRFPTSRRAHHFDFCRSFSIEISRVSSATIRFSRPFSRSSAFSR